MKKSLLRRRMFSFVTLLVALLCVTAIFCSCDMFSDDVQYAVVSENNLSSDGFYYTLYENRTAAITGYSDSAACTLTIPAKVDSYKVVEIGEGAFLQNSLLRYIRLSEGVRKISANAFQRCSALVRIDLVSSVQVIGRSAFDSCLALTEVNYTSGVVTIEDAAFYQCKSLSGIILPEGLQTIGKEAFFSCESLTKLQLPEKLYGMPIVYFL